MTQPVWKRCTGPISSISGPARRSSGCCALKRASICPTRSSHCTIFAGGQGSVRIYGIHEDSRVFGVSYARTDTLLGDIEFCQINHSPFFTEADEPVLCLSLPFAENRAVLENDPVFLRFVMGQLARKLVTTSKQTNNASFFILFCFLSE